MKKITTNTTSTSELLIQSGITIAMIFVALILGDLIQPWGTDVSLSITPKGSATTYYKIMGVWLVLGAVSMSYLLFGWRVLPAVFIGFHVSALYVFGWSIDPFVQKADGSYQITPLINHAHALVTTLGPLIAIYTMHVFKLSKFFEGKQLVFQHVIFLMILASLYNTIAKFWIETSFRTWLGGTIRIDQETHIPSMLIGDLTGGIGFVFVLALVVVPFIRLFVPNTITQE